MNGFLSVSSFCEVCSAVSRSTFWAWFFEKLAHFLAFVVKVGVVTGEASLSEELRVWHGIFYVLWMRGRM